MCSHFIKKRLYYVISFICGEKELCEAALSQAVQWYKSQMQLHLPICHIQKYYMKHPEFLFF